MDRKTVNMFVNTCSYLNFIMDEIMASNTQVPPDTILTVNELMSKLFSFMNHVHRNSLTPSLPGTGVRVDVQLHRGQTLSPVVLEGTPVSHYGVPTSGRVVVTPNYNLPKQSTVTVAQSECEMKQTSAANGFDNPVEVNKSLEIAIDKVVPCHKESQSTADANITEELKIPSDVYITKLYCCYTDGILKGEITAANIGVYCRVCDSICVGQWAAHVNEENHFEKCSDLKKLKMYSCCLCKLTIYGSKKLILKYFEYHFKKIHVGKGQLNWEEALIEVHCGHSQSGSTSSSIASVNHSSKNKKPRKKKKATNDQSNSNTTSTSQTSSSKSNSKNVNEVPSKNVKTDLLPDNNTDGGQNSHLVKIAQNDGVLQKNNNGEKNNVNSPKSAKSNNAVPQNTSSVKSAKKEPPTTPVSKVPHNTPATSPNKNSPANPHVIIPPSKKNDDVLSPSPYPSFDSLLCEIIRTWRDKSIQISAGFCDVCQVGILSAFDWFNHVDVHENEHPSTWTEQMCPRCNIKIFGQDHKKYLNSSNHCKVDKILSQS